jgi:hypothetical protein
MKYELPPDNRNRPDEELLADLNRVAAELSQPTVLRGAYEKHGRFAPGTLINRFGSWNEALRKAGLGITKRQAIPDAELLQDLLRVAGELGGQSLTQRFYDVHGSFSHDAFVRSFGGWREALTAAKLDASHIPDAPDAEELFRNLASVWERLGCAPRKDDMRKPLSHYSAAPYLRLCGSWRRTLKAFVAASNEGSPDLTVQSSGGSAPAVRVPGPARKRTPRNPGWRLRFLVMRRDNFRCRICGAVQNAHLDVRLDIDHILAWDSGGETVMDNLQTLCNRCNGGKSNLPMGRGV